MGRRRRRCSLSGWDPVFAAPSLPPPVPPESGDQRGMDVGVAVLSRWPILQARQHRLPSVNRAEPAALVATLDHPSGPLHFVTSCVEWEPDFAADHLAQTRALAALLGDPALDGPLPVLLAADLNASPDSPEVRALTEVMVDTWVAGGGDPRGVTLSSKNPFAPIEARKQIDRASTSCWPGRASPGSAFTCNEPSSRTPPSATRTLGPLRRHCRPHALAVLHLPPAMSMPSTVR